VSTLATPANAQVFYGRPYIAPSRPFYSTYYRPWSYYGGPRAYYWNGYTWPNGYYYYGPRAYVDTYSGPQVYRPSWAPNYYWR
jgi:hypothetical protein